jgi:hypothetical protein
MEFSASRDLIGNSGTAFVETQRSRPDETPDGP